MKRYLGIIVAMFYLCSCNQEKMKRWDFNTLDGWVYAHQDTNPNDQCSIEDGILKIYTTAQSKDRKKVSTKDKKYTTGRYTWKTFISDLGKGDQTSIGSWIYCDDHHEIDFEVGYGKQEIRDKLGAKDDEVIAYMTTQDNPYQSTQKVLKKGWHIFEIDITSIDGKYFVEWIIDGETVSQVQQTYGNEISFHIFCSVENLLFMGDAPASKDNYGLFDYVAYQFHP